MVAASPYIPFSHPLSVCSPSEPHLLCGLPPCLLCLSEPLVSHSLSIWPASQALGIPRVSESLQNWGAGLKESIIKNDTTKGRCGGITEHLLFWVLHLHTFIPPCEISGHWSVGKMSDDIRKQSCSTSFALRHQDIWSPPGRFTNSHFVGTAKAFCHPQVPEGLICANNICPRLTQMLAQAHTHM